MSKRVDDGFITLAYRRAGKLRLVRDCRIHDTTEKVIFVRVLPESEYRRLKAANTKREE